MSTTLVLTEELAAQLLTMARLPIETGAVLLARPVGSPENSFRLLANTLVPVPDDAYERRTSHSLSILSHGYVPALRDAEQREAIAIWLHTHPGDGASPQHSDHDVVVDRQLSDLFRLRSGSAYYGSVVVSHRNNHLCFSGHLETPENRFAIQRLLTVGARLSLVLTDGADSPPMDSLFDRNIRAFGGDIQRVLAELRVAIVGCGGTGSAVAEQLVRLGVRHFIAIDPDSLSESNLTRVYGSGPSDVGRKKVDVLADSLARIAPAVVVERVPSMVTVERTARRLADADVIFGCTDDNAGRLVLSRIATYLMKVVIDCGVLLTTDSAGHLTGIDGRVTMVHPGAACLVCRDRIDLARAASELLTPEERLRREDEGYAPALIGIEPAVVTFTTSVAACAVGELLEKLARFGPEPVPSEILLRLHDREISTNIQSSRERHYCHPASGKIGLGMTVPFLEQLWQG